MEHALSDLETLANLGFDPERAYTSPIWYTP
jgi:hypothetical protein